MWSPGWPSPRSGPASRWPRRQRPGGRRAGWCSAAPWSCSAWCCSLTGSPPTWTSCSGRWRWSPSGSRSCSWGFADDDRAGPAGSGRPAWAGGGNGAGGGAAGPHRDRLAAGRRRGRGAVAGAAARGPDRGRPGLCGRGLPGPPARHDGRRGALLRCPAPGRSEAVVTFWGSDHQGQFVDRHGHSPVRWLLDRQLVVSAPKILHQGVSGDGHSGTAVLFETAHGTQSRLQPPVIALDPVVGVPISAVPGCWQQVLQHGRVDRRLIGGDLDGRDPGRVNGLVEEPTGGLGVSARGDEYVNDLPELVDRTVDVTPAPSHLHIRLVHLPAVT